MARWRIDHPVPGSVFRYNENISESKLSTWRVKADILTRGGGITRQWVWNDNDLKEVWTLMVRWS